jgi:hypothetical protein
VNAAGQPAEGVRVCALDTASCGTSDARGVFRIGELRAGGYRLEILPLEGLPFITDSMDVRAGLDGTVEITLPAVEDFQQTVTVTAPAFRAPEAVKNSGFLVEPREILKSAAALQDVSRYVQGLPGVVIGTNDFRNDIIVRGGSPLENLFVVDNVEIPNINAFANFASAGGTVSLLDAELLQDVTFPHRRVPRALHQPHVERAAGDAARGQPQAVRRVGDARLCRRRRHFRRAHQVGKGAGSWVSARRSFLDLFTKDVGIGGVPVLYALNAKAVYDLTPGIASGWSTSRASTRFGSASPSPPTSKTRLPTSTSATTAGAAPRASTGNAPSGHGAWACSASATPRPRSASR